MICRDCCLNPRTPYVGFGFRSQTCWWQLSGVTQDLSVCRTKLACLSADSFMGKNLSQIRSLLLSKIRDALRLELKYRLEFKNWKR